MPLYWYFDLKNITLRTNLDIIFCGRSLRIIHQCSAIVLVWRSKYLTIWLPRRSGAQILIAFLAHWWWGNCTINILGIENRQQLFGRIFYHWQWCSALAIVYSTEIILPIWLFKARPMHNSIKDCFAREMVEPWQSLTDALKSPL